MPEDFKPGTMGCHEALHMAAFLANAVDEELCAHPAIKADPIWLSMATEAQRILADLYQAIGAAHLKDGE